MGLKFIDALLGNRGAQDAPEIEERKGLFKLSAVNAELIKHMKDPTITFMTKYNVEHDWVNNFALNPKPSKRVMHDPYELDPDVPWVNDTKTQSDSKAMKVLYSTFKSRVSTLNNNLDTSGNGTTDELFHWCDPHNSGKSTLHCAVVAKLLYGSNMEERNTVLEGEGDEDSYEFNGLEADEDTLGKRDVVVGGEPASSTGASSAAPASLAEKKGADAGVGINKPINNKPALPSGGGRRGRGGSGAAKKSTYESDIASGKQPPTESNQMSEYLAIMTYAKSEELRQKEHDRVHLGDFTRAEDDRSKSAALLAALPLSQAVKEHEAQKIWDAHIAAQDQKKRAPQFVPQLMPNEIRAVAKTVVAQEPEGTTPLPARVSAPAIERLVQAENSSDTSDQDEFDTEGRSESSGKSGRDYVKLYSPQTKAVHRGSPDDFEQDDGEQVVLDTKLAEPGASGVGVLQLDDDDDKIALPLTAKRKAGLQKQTQKKKAFAKHAVK